MKIIKRYGSDTLKDFERDETRVFNILTRSLTVDELSDLCNFRGINTLRCRNKTQLAKAFMTGLGRFLTFEHFSNLGKR